MADNPAAPGLLKFCGFSVGGVEWLGGNVADARDAAERRERLGHVGYEEARLTAAMGGNILRLFYTPAILCQSLTSEALDLSGLPTPQAPPFYRLGEAEKLAECDRVEAFLSALFPLDGVAPNGEGLGLHDLDAYLAGVTRLNRSPQGVRNRIRVLLTLVLLPPRAIIEAPRDQVFAAAGRKYAFRHLYNMYCGIFARIARMLVQRYSVMPGEERVVCAYEVNNEPDYEWLPDELRIEKSADPRAYPLHKYVTELHLSQIPDRQLAAAAFETTPWGGYQDQTGCWNDSGTDRPGTPLREFDWGEKFDWYLRCYGEFAEHYSYALHHESRQAGVAPDILSAGVTHNNLDYLARLAQAAPGAFTYCTGIALHPYHWPRHDISDTHFVGTESGADWREASPRRFARDYLKRFDFLTEAARLVQSGRRLGGMFSRLGRGWGGWGRGPRALAGKKLWLTEFGFPTKVPGTYNEIGNAHIPFIRPRAWPAEAIPHPSAVWEDLWDRFFEQVTPDWLARQGVDAMMFYTLRETAEPGFDKHDDDRSNFALLKRNGLARLDGATLQRLGDFMSSATGSPGARPFAPAPVPPWGRRRTLSTPHLRAAPWRGAAPPAAVTDSLSMLTKEEKQFLFWVTGEYFQNRGAIIDAGCFVGGSTVALAAGLAASYPDVDIKIDSYDRFETDSFMQQYYFGPAGLTTEGNRFRHIYDRAIAGWHDRVRVHDGDVTRAAWTGGPIEILFLDICKTWEVNDHCTRSFFPHLIPGHSLVIQQDFFHQWEFWVILTMERLREHFEFIGFVPWNTAVFRCIAPVPAEIVPERLRAFGLPELERLLRAHIANYDMPYLVAILNCALMGLYLDFGEHDKLEVLKREVETKYRDQPYIADALSGFALG